VDYPRQHGILQVEGRSPDARNHIFYRAADRKRLI